MAGPDTRTRHWSTAVLLAALLLLLGLAHECRAAAESRPSAAAMATADPGPGPAHMAHMVHLADPVQLADPAPVGAARLAPPPAPGGDCCAPADQQFARFAASRSGPLPPVAAPADSTAGSAGPDAVGPPDIPPPAAATGRRRLTALCVSRT
ncbi:hypothetical protein GCM10009760_08800 [Kitasatospora kazusensis]|uniref:Uncharacterized protein n=1 Tax=Kitasatospora kazusensis TaxID=407974 RepID=A0ABN2YVH0_9ACTN